MATARSSAQHYIECGNCEDNPAQFLCKTCSGHLCESCKSEHERRKIFQNHDIIPLTSEKGNSLGLLHCTQHKTKTLECYCSPCRVPVCTQCMMGDHNGHTVESLDEVYNRIKDGLRRYKKEIEDKLLPRYKKSLAHEIAEKAKISQRTDEVQRQIEDHTKEVIHEVKAITRRKIQELRHEEQEALRSVEDQEIKIERRIERLEDMKTQITYSLVTRPSVGLFSKACIDYDFLNEMRHFPKENNFRIDDFEPGSIDVATLERDFGDLPYYEDQNKRVDPLDRFSIFRSHRR